MKQKVIGYLILEDLLENSPLTIGDLTVDAIVSVLVIQEGKDILVDDIVIDGNILDLENEQGNIEYSPIRNMDEDFMDEVYSKIEQIAITRAKQTTEDLWDYRLVD